MIESEKRITTDQNSFQAGGIKYLIHGSLPIEFYRVLEELQVRARFGSNFVSIHRGLEALWAKLNKHEFAAASVDLHNLMQGTARGVNKQHDPILLLCTLFCWPEGEERRDWSEEMANERLKAWSEEGYPVEDFFALGLFFIRHYQRDFLPDSPNISEQAETNQHQDSQ